MTAQAAAGAPSLASASGEQRTVRVAGLWRRLAATLVDAIILSPVFILLGYVAFRVTGYRLPVGPDLRLETLVELFLEGGAMLYSLLAMGLVILLLYGFLFMATTGATPGLRVVGLRVISIYGETPAWWRVLLRCAGFLLSGLLLGLGFIWIAFDREKRGLHDWMAGTYVISRRGETARAPALQSSSPG